MWRNFDYNICYLSIEYVSYSKQNKITLFLIKRQPYGVGNSGIMMKNVAYLIIKSCHMYNVNFVNPFHTLEFLNL